MAAAVYVKLKKRLYLHRGMAALECVIDEYVRKKATYGF